jgi:hypothetical protein
MITIIIKSNEKKEINLPSFKRERELIGAWHSMKRDIKYAQKAFLFNSKDGSKFKVRVPDIKDIFLKEEVIEAEATKADKNEIERKAKETLNKA